MVRKIKDRTRARFHLPVSEVGGLDTWQRLVLGFALVGTDRATLEALVADVVRFIDGMGLAELAGDQREVMVYGEEDADMLGMTRERSAGQHGDRARNEPMVPDDDPGDDQDQAQDDDDSWIPESWKSEEPEGP